MKRRLYKVCGDFRREWGISVSVLTWYRGMPLLEGTSFPMNNIKRWGYSELNLSDEVDVNEAHRLAGVLKDCCMTYEDYYDIKRVGYMARVFY